MVSDQIKAMKMKNQKILRFKQLLMQESRLGKGKKDHFLSEDDIKFIQSNEYHLNTWEFPYKVVIRNTDEYSEAVSFSAFAVYSVNGKKKEKEVFWEEFFKNETNKEDVWRRFSEFFKSQDNYIDDVKYILEGQGYDVLQCNGAVACALINDDETGLQDVSQRKQVLKFLRLYGGQIYNLRFCNLRKAS